MASNVYKSIVKIGNWYENQFAEEAQRLVDEKLQETTASYKSALDAYLNDIPLSVCPDQLIHLGNKVLLNVPSTLLFKGGPLERRGRVTVCVSPSSLAIKKGLSLTNTCLTASPVHLDPCQRNVFSLLPRLISQSIDDVLCYGESFDIGYVSPKGDTFYVTSPPGIAIYSGKGSRRQEVSLEDFSSPYSSWKIEPIRDQDREQMIGKPVEVGERIGIYQMMTNQPLVVEEDFTMSTAFGLEPDVSAGVVSRATTRATSVFTLLTNTNSNSNSDQDENEQEEIVE